MGREMRRKDRMVTEIEAKLDIIRGCRICRLGLLDEEGIYVVPMNFGFSYENGVLKLYFHCAPEGRKMDAIKRHPQVGFEMDGEGKLIPGEKACAYGYQFQSIIGSGTAALVTEPEEKKKALQYLMQQQTGRAFSFSDAEAASVTVFRVTAKEFSGKRRSGF